MASPAYLETQSSRAALLKPCRETTETMQPVFRNHSQGALGQTGLTETPRTPSVHSSGSARETWPESGCREWSRGRLSRPRSLR